MKMNSIAGACALLLGTCAMATSGSASALVATALFEFISIPLMERHLLSRRGYVDYQRRTSRLVPWFRR